jgi:integral membrane sensor domain MASE1
VIGILAAGAIYYLATRLAWLLTFPDSKVSLFFPPHAILVSILLLVPTRRWWAYVLAAVSVHFVATQQAGWPTLYALQCEAFDAFKMVITAGGIRWFIKSPLHLINLREAIRFVLVAVIIIPFGVALWGAAFTVYYGFGTEYWVEWRNLAISNAVTTIVLVPVILIGVHLFRTGLRPVPTRILEGCLLVAGIVAVGWLTFDRSTVGPGTSPALLYAPIPLLIWAALRFGLGGVSASVLLITSFAIWGTMLGRGPFLAQSAVENALALQLFILFAATPLLLLAVAIDDEKRSKQALVGSEQRMTLAAESAQLALWEWEPGAGRGLGPGPGTVRLSAGHAHRSRHAGRQRPSRRSLAARGCDPACACEWRPLRVRISRHPGRWYGALDFRARPQSRPRRPGSTVPDPRYRHRHHEPEESRRRRAAAT